jgi:hypothetical protein
MLLAVVAEPGREGMGYGRGDILVDTDAAGSAWPEKFRERIRAGVVAEGCDSNDEGSKDAATVLLRELSPPMVLLVVVAESLADWEGVCATDVVA